MKTKSSITRRDFIRRAAGLGVGILLLPRRVLGGQGYVPPSEEITRAVIGVGGMGKAHLRYPGARTLAVCDVDADHLKQAVQVAGEGVAAYSDFREVLQRDDIDVVHVATPPHWHALISIAAVTAGKDVWCEKPLTRTIGEGIKLVNAVKRTGRLLRINTWFRFQDNFYGFGSPVRPIKKLVSSGMLGWPLRVTVGAATGFEWKFYWCGRTDLVPEKVPEVLDYDFWLGPAPYKPYHPHRVHGTFRGYWDYDGGGLGDMGQHYLDPVQYILGKDDTSPVEVEVDAPQQHPDAVGTWRRICLRYADGCEIILDGEDSKKRVPYIEGPDGVLYKGFECNIPDINRKLATLPDPEPQVTDFYEAVRKRKTFALNESNGHRSCTLVNMAKIAVQLGRNLKFDPVAQRFLGDDAANRLLDQPMRAPWGLA